ncbi:MAG: valine--tRNA ligase [Candidatus Micrarchaeia archaeon]
MEDKYDPKSIEPKIIDFWEREKVFAFDRSSKKPIYSIDTPPPTISGFIHMGHIFSYSQTEFIARYKRMRGYNVFYPFGLDNNGLPTELLIEKKYNVAASQIGREKFWEIAAKAIPEYNEMYISIFKRLGISVDWSLIYQTISKDVQKISQKSFIELYKMGRIERRKSPVLYCPKCNTVVSQMELTDKQVKSKLVYIKFGENIVVATSRPELIPACVGIFVNPNDDRYKGMVGKIVKVPISGQEVKVYSDESIKPDFGTGAEMCCTFGDQNDIYLYKKYNLDLRIVIGDDGKFSAGPYKGLGIKEARERIIDDLKEKGLVVKEEEIVHSVNVHERCETEIEYLVKEQWFIKYLDMKEQLIGQGQKVKWFPEYMRVRYENWVNGLKWDWCISRQRYFGINFPVWYCKKCGKPKIASEEDLPVNPFIDKPKEPCECGSKEFVPETDVLDTWATSSLTPLINARWGLDNAFSYIYPMDLRANAYDIIAMWDFTTIAKSLFHTNSIPWRNVMISGQGLDPHGKPMHKSKGNVVEPMPYIEKYGADAVRYWASSSMLGEDNNFQEKEIIAGARLANKLWNLAKFVSMRCSNYKNDNTIPSSPLDNYMIKSLNQCIEKATQYFDSYDYFKARNTAEELFWRFANDYVEFVKNRIFANDAAAKRLVSVIFLDMLKMLAPFIPFVTEEIYQELYAKNGAKSIHIAEWPSKDALKFDERLAQEGEKVYKVALFIRQWKHNQRMPLSGEIRKTTIQGISNEALSDLSAAMNIKSVEEGQGAMEVPYTDIKLSIEK